jgi:serine/threonine protein kinase
MSETLKPGSTLGAYEIISFIASGGMGSVYKARNRILGDYRAIKVILPSLSANQEFVGRFVREAQLASRIQHPNVVKMLEPAMDGTTMFLPMELLEGESLSDLLKRDAPLHPALAIELVVAIGAGVHALHTASIIHRDLKPANVFLHREHGTIVPKVLDFGAAREVQHDGEQTSTGQVIGSAHYMPLEQASGRKDIDHRVDQYAVAVMMYLMLTRRRPYENDTMGVALAKIIQGLPYPNVRELSPWVPEAVATVLHRALARERDQRFETTQAFCDALAAVKQSTDAVVMPTDMAAHFANSFSTGSEPGRPAVGFGLGESSSDIQRQTIAPAPTAETSGPSQQTILPQEYSSSERVASASRWSKAPLLFLFASIAILIGVTALSFSRLSKPASRGSNVSATQTQTQTQTQAGSQIVPGTHGSLTETRGDSAGQQDGGMLSALLPSDSTTVLNANPPQATVSDSGSGAQTAVVNARTQRGNTVRTNPVRTNTNGNANANANSSRGGCVPRPGIPCL